MYESPVKNFTGKVYTFNRLHEGRTESHEQQFFVK